MNFVRRFALLPPADVLRGCNFLRRRRAARSVTDAGTGSSRIRQWVDGGWSIYVQRLLPAEGFQLSSHVQPRCHGALNRLALALKTAGQQ
jgi:hypothetical protein